MLPDVRWRQRPPLVISVLRWSADPQDYGDSERRQDAVIQEYADALEWSIDKKLVMPHTSASDGKHRSIKTPYGQFLVEIKEGLIPDGTALLAELEDRLGREMSIRSTHQVYKLTRQGIHIHICETGTVYNRETMKDPNVVAKLQNALNLAWHETEKKRARILKQKAEIRTEAIEKGRPIPGKQCSWLTREGWDKKGLRDAKHRGLPEEPYWGRLVLSGGPETQDHRSRFVR
jgi:DNA invertase Pin-like site-specific DNA recombinase